MTSVTSTARLMIPAMAEANMNGSAIEQGAYVRLLQSWESRKWQFARIAMVADGMIHSAEMACHLEYGCLNLSLGASLERQLAVLMAQP